MQGNKIAGSHNGILGGRGNTAVGRGNAIAGGESNTIEGSPSDDSFIGSGQFNSAGGNFNGIVAGQQNSIDPADSWCLIGAGEENSISDGAFAGAILTGMKNKIGRGSSISPAYPVILGGTENVVTDSYALVYGQSLQTDRPNQTVFGYYNASTNGYGVFVIGGGGPTSRRNLLMLDYNGELYIAGSIHTNWGGGSSGGDSSGGTGGTDTEGGSDAESGTNDYNNLENRPKIEGVTLEGNKSFDDLGLLDYFSSVISDKSTDKEAASAKAVYDYVNSVLGGGNTSGDNTGGGDTGGGNTGGGTDTGGSTGGSIDYDQLDSRYAAKNHTHSEYAAANHAHSQYLTTDDAKKLIYVEIDRIASDGITVQSQNVLCPVGNNTDIGAASAEVVSMSFSAAAACVPLFSVTVPYTVTAAGTVDFSVILDGEAVNVYSETAATGKHFAVVTLPLIDTDSGNHTVSLSVSSEDAVGTVEGERVYATLSGFGLTERDKDTPDVPDTPADPDTERTHSGELYVTDPGINYTITTQDVSKAAISVEVEPMDLDTPKITLI